MLNRPLLEHKTIAQLVVAFLFYIFPVLVFARLAGEVADRNTMHVDIQILQWLHQFTAPALNGLALAITTIGSPEVVVACTLTGAVALYLRRHRRAALALVVGVGGAAVINTVLKLSFQRVRPHLWVPMVRETSYSFPSGHAMVSSALVFTIMYLLWHTWYKWWAIGVGLSLTFLIGLSRLYVGVHYPSDVLGGWLVGFTWVVVMREVLSRSANWVRRDRVAKA
jgi:membrane-associated phospholipid phosphatase